MNDQGSPATRNREALALALVLGRVRTALLDGIATKLAQRGYGGYRRAYGNALAHLHYVDGATAATLGRQLDVTKQAASQLLTQLMAAGYAEPRPHPTDGRSHEIVTTSSGQALLGAAEQAAADTTRRWQVSMSPEGIDELFDNLCKIAWLENHWRQQR